MDPLILLQRAQDAGLRLQLADTSLKISGPRKAEPLVRLLAKHKSQALRKVQEVQKVPRTDRSRYLLHFLHPRERIRGHAHPLANE
jgi:leucyl aminopeptidase (aminopeptidase T)